jgi:hypothetical protein
LDSDPTLNRKPVSRFKNVRLRHAVLLVAVTLCEAGHIGALEDLGILHIQSFASVARKTA